MPPQTKPINTRLAEVSKLFSNISNKAAKAGKDSSKEAATVAKATAKFNQENLKTQRLITAEAAKQTKYYQQNLALTKKMAASGGPGGPVGPGGMGPGRGANRPFSRYQNLAGALGMRRFMPAMIPAALIGTAVGMISSQMRSSIDTFGSTVKTQRDVAGMIDPSKIRALTRHGAPLGFGPSEILDTVQGVGRAVGVRRPGEFPVGAAAAMLQARQQFGIDQGEGLDLLTSIRRGGMTGFDVNEKGQMEGGLRTFRRIMTDGVASGLEKTRVPEHMANVSKGIQSVGEFAAGRVDAGAISGLLAQLGGLGAGFQGTRGAGVMNALQESFIQASRLQGDPAKQAAMLMDVGGFGGPAGTNNIFKARLQLEKGISDPENLTNLISGHIRRFGAGELGAMTFSDRTGISLSKSQKLMEFGASGFKNKKDFEATMAEAIPETLDVNTKALELSAKQAQVQLQQFEMGEQLLDVVLDIQILIGQLVEYAVPYIRSILETIKEFLDLVKEGMAIIKEYLSNKGTQTPETRARMEEISGLEQLPPEQRKQVLQGYLEAQRSEVAEIGKKAAQYATENPDPFQLNDAKLGEFGAQQEAAKAAAAEIEKEIKKIEDRQRWEQTRKEEADALRRELSQKRTEEKAETEARFGRERDAALEKANTILEKFTVLPDTLGKTVEEHGRRAGNQPSHGINLGDTP